MGVIDRYHGYRVKDPCVSEWVLPYHEFTAFYLRASGGAGKPRTYRSDGFSHVAPKRPMTTLVAAYHSSLGPHRFIRWMLGLSPRRRNRVTMPHVKLRYNTLFALIQLTPTRPGGASQLGGVRPAGVNPS
ncbi:hypothetical protein BV898_04259 [Hypsibius exemplaris]|uniref:Uncharacterized protein n=1 Tax=Hypsibius exemplaris TaxID=2072580 RepID=A0A1W0X2V8_HYPEX|nr:hypothetical protein BV898_04259 [Hypsibius exemplaris]